MINIPHWLKRRFRISDIHARVGGRRAPPPAPSGMKGAHADGVFAFVGAPMPVEAARLAPCPAIANEDIAGWPSRAYRLCGGATIYVAAASWLAPRAHIGVGHSKTPSGAQGRPAGIPPQGHLPVPAGSAGWGARSAGGNRAGTPVPAPPGCGGSSTRMGGKAPAVTIARAGKTPTALRNPPARRNKSARIRTFP